MNKFLTFFGALTLVGSIAQADCYTNSRGYNFRGYDISAATSACRSHPSTSNSECDRNVTCDAYGGGGQNACSTQSRGYQFTGPDAYSAVRACQSHPSTSNSECDRNVVCGSVGGYPGNPGYPPPYTPEPPPYTPAPPPIGTPGGDVCFFEHSQFRGNSFCLGRNESVAKLPSNWNDRISSISIPRGVKVLIYEHANFGGNVAEMTQSGELPSAWWNDKISSISTRRAGGGGGGGHGPQPGPQPGPHPGPAPHPHPGPAPHPQPGPHPGPAPHPQPPSMSDAQCYLQRYPDICQNSKPYCKDPAAHYRNHGRAEGRIWGCQR
jgi:hypothetical protein